MDSKPLEIMKNPWDVPSLDEYLFYCYPECELKTKEYEIFYNHAVIVHELAKETLEASKTSNNERKTLYENVPRKRKKNRDIQDSATDLIEEPSSKTLCGFKCPDCHNIIHPTLFEKHKKVCQVTGNDEHPDIEEVEPNDVNTQTLLPTSDDSVDPLDVIPLEEVEDYLGVEIGLAEKQQKVGVQEFDNIKVVLDRSVVDKFRKNSIKVITEEKDEDMIDIKEELDIDLVKAEQDQNKPESVEKMQLFECEICNKVFKIEASWKQHKKRAHERKRKCIKCSKYLKNENDLVKHYARVHVHENGGKESQECDKCYKILDMSYLQVHLQHIHEEKLDRKEPKNIECIGNDLF